jgi:hypothetical protein
VRERERERERDIDRDRETERVGGEVHSILNDVTGEAVGRASIDIFDVII